MSEAHARITTLAASAREAKGRGDLVESMLRFETAIRLAELEGAAMDAETLTEFATQLREAKRHDELVDFARPRLSAGGDRLRILLAQGLRALERGEEALEVLSEVGETSPDYAMALIHRGLVHLDRKDPRAASALFASAVAVRPEASEHHRLLAVARRRADDFAGAGAAFEEALRLAPKSPQAWLDLIVLREEEGRVDEALALADRGIHTAGPQRRLVETRIILLRRRGRHSDAVAWIENLLETNESVFWLHFQMAMTVQNFDRPRATRHLERARELAPTDTQVIVALAESHNRSRGPEEAAHIARAHALARERLTMPGDIRPDARPLYGIFLRTCDHEGLAALGSFETLGHYWAATGADTALQLLLSQVETADQRRALVPWHARAMARVDEEAARTPLPRLPPAPAIGGRAKIRIGLMSSDLRDHPVGYFVRPLIQHYDRDRFELHAYSWYARRPDSVQTWMAGRVDGFHHHYPIADRPAAQMIREHRLDVLFDLGGTTDMNKLAVMAWRPAARQASWLGYPHSAGLGAIDRILTDPWLEPKDPALLLEKPFRLAHTWVAFEQPGFGPVTPIDPVTPEERNGFVTFGTMNNPYKFNPTLLATWAEVLRRVPGSRFVFVRPEAIVTPFRENIARAFEAQGVSPDRIDWIGVRGQHLPHYGRMDIALDSFPQTGGTTTCETLWMGVPVVSLVGEAFFERLSHSNLTNAGLGEFAVDTREAYVETAVRLAQNGALRAALRRTMRERLRAHPLGDARAFARDFEAAVTAWVEEPRD